MRKSSEDPAQKNAAADTAKRRSLPKPCFLKSRVFQFSTLNSKSNIFYFTAAETEKQTTDTICLFVNRTFLFHSSFVFIQITVIYLLRWPPAAAWTTWSKCILLEPSKRCCNRNRCSVWCLSGREGFSAGLKKKKKKDIACCTCKRIRIWHIWSTLVILLSGFQNM